MKKGKQAASQQQIQIQNVPQPLLQILPKQMKLENPKKSAKPFPNNQNQQQIQNIPPQNPESGQKMKKQSTHLILPSIYRGNNFQQMQKKRQASASRENNNLPAFIGDKKDDEDEDIFSESDNKAIRSQRKIQRPQSFIVKKKEKKGDSISSNITPSNKMQKMQSNKQNQQFSSNNSPTLSEKTFLKYDDILQNVQSTKNIEKIKFNPWKRFDEKKEENYEKLLVQLNDLKKKHKEQVELYQQKQQNQDFNNPNFLEMQQKHEKLLLENKNENQQTPHSLPVEQKENLESFQQIIKQNSLGLALERQGEKQIENFSKVSSSSSQKADQSSIGLVSAPLMAEQSQDMDRNIWKRKKINERNQIMEECSSIERELYQINFLHNKNQKAINEYINTQNSLLKLNLQMKKQVNTNQPTQIKEKN
ncbi:hypothetical protein TTHERM_00355510 (macronuclear) [Tetrahymena thermophila SB210]|uniref:Uncharacterized protein n=1 Tax=Tetrahymena thermophila (strain SB210) TaxID=312017 RepID=Q22Y20_TETTS|nr:hypothetical protein TTHERM_00355510 [Tetrahymena thermophila SB210]EAR90204.1 hypothetical protein TTHERM_00355510 [Tetrahymena thermophila SB210]|eukprot:XP_001010449.1 hypothetical protein TTHERM_00355510 [Tetrahymena thermophila SB210]